MPIHPIRRVKHFASSGRLLLFLILLALPRPGLRADQIIYTDALTNGWQNWSWAAVNLANTSPVHSGSHSISVTTSNWSALYLDTAALNSAPYTNLIFWVNGGPAGGQPVVIQGLLSGSAQPGITLAPLPTNSWRQVTISLSALGVANKTNVTGFWWQGNSAGTLPTFYVDDITLTTNAITAATNPSVNLLINAAANRHAISPLIYGVAFAASSNELADLNAPVHRSGGNETTRYNWSINAANHAADWYFESLAESSSAAGGDGDDFIRESKGGGAQAMLTIPMLGWVAKLGPNRARLASYLTNSYGAQAASDPYWSAAGNGVTPAGVNITNNNPADANQISTTDFQAGWVRHLTNQWGFSTNGGLRYYLMDNEWSLWFSTHRDVHPIGPTMSEVLGDFSSYSAMVKGIDPNALVAGPEEWGWPGYFYSGYDQQWSGAHSDYNPADYPDRQAHGGQDFGPWFLSQMNQLNQSTGQRLLDIFTLHCYPQEGSVGEAAVIDPATELLRNQSTRQFWDTNYVDPSWVNSVIALIPRMKSWVATNYPGTLIGITEYNWGADAYISGGTAQADLLGIFGREGLDLASRWTEPATNTPTYNAFKMYRNYDGGKSTFGDTSVLTVAPNPDVLSAFAAVRSADGALTVMVINKDLYNASPFNAALVNFNATGTAHRWQLTASNLITHLSDVALTNRDLGDTVPSQSITLYILPGVNPFSLQLLPTNNLALWLTGQTGLTYSLQTSTDLLHWVGVATNTLTSNSIIYALVPTNRPAAFYRGLWSP